MAIPKFEDFLYPFLNFLKEKDLSLKDMRVKMREHFSLTEEECLSQKTNSGKDTQFNNRLGWARQYLRRAKFIEITTKGTYSITQRGRDYLDNNTSLSIEDLKNFKEFAEFAGDSVPTKTLINENWLEIVEILEQYDFKETSEKLLFSLIESCFRTLGWKKTNGSMTIREIHGSKEVNQAIFLNHRTCTDFLIAIPVKDSELFDYKSETENLFIQFNCKLIVTICNEIKVFYKINKSPNSKIVCISTTKITNDSEEGSIICNALSYEKFDIKSLESFCYEKANLNSDRRYIRELFSSWSSNPSDIKDIIELYLVNEGFDKEDIAYELDKVFIKFGKKSDISPTNDTFSTQSNNYDRTKYSFDGGVTFHNKRRFVLEVVRQYIKDHPNASLDDLEIIFPSNIISKKRGVIRPLSVVNKWILEHPDVANRYFLNNDDIITLADGEKIVVHNQWGTNFPHFLKIACEFYNVVNEQGESIRLESDDNVDKLNNIISISKESLMKFTDK